MTEPKEKPAAPAPQPLQLTHDLYMGAAGWLSLDIRTDLLSMSSQEKTLMLNLLKLILDHGLLTFPELGFDPLKRS